MVKVISSKDEFTATMKEDKYVIVDFTATWCGPCKAIGPKFEEFSNIYKNLIFLKVDVDANDDIAAECGVSAMPTFQVFLKGAKVAELVGANPQKLEDVCKQYDTAPPS